jgi:threonylcarbamoyladenosine tRNA methylthiotransferase MtaB
VKFETFISLILVDKKAVYYTLGCKLNFSETSSIGKMLKDVGVRTVRKGEKADICVINTCPITLSLMIFKNSTTF